MKALSVRQPWAWAIIHAGKDIENRSTGAIRHMNFDRVARLAIHAAKGMTREEYEYARDFMRAIGVICPPPADLRRGGIIGTVSVGGVAMVSASPWFFGPRGIILKHPEPCAFTAAIGALGLFEWKPADPAIAPPPARWMLRATMGTAGDPAWLIAKPRE